MYCERETNDGEKATRKKYSETQKVCSLEIQHDNTISVEKASAKMINAISGNFGYVNLVQVEFGGERHKHAHIS